LLATTSNSRRDGRLLTYDPLSDVVDEALNIDSGVLEALKNFRTRAKLPYLPGVDTAVERARLSKVLDEVADTLIQGIEAHPSKLWVMTQFQRGLILVELEDTEGREHFGTELEDLMDILGIESSDGLLSAYLGGL
jgi:hypothetical protein